MAVQEEYTLEQAAEDVGDLRGQVDRLNEILQLFDGPVPNLLSTSSSQLFSQNGQPNYLNFAGLQMGLMGAQPATFPGNTATGGVVSMASMTIPANDAAVGAVYEIEVWGNGTVGSSVTNVQMTWEVVLGGSVMANITTGTGFFNTANLAFRWHMSGRAICHTTGVGGTWTSLIFGEVSSFTNPDVPGAGSQDTAGLVSCESTGTTTKDTTAAQTLGVSALWGSANAGQAITSTVAIAKRIC